MWRDLLSSRDDGVKKTALSSRYVHRHISSWGLLPLSFLIIYGVIEFSKLIISLTLALLMQLLAKVLNKHSVLCFEALFFF